jgi:hypothetical protein
LSPIPEYTFFFMTSSRNADGPTYLLDSSTLIALQLKEPFHPRHLLLPKFYQRPLEQDPVQEGEDNQEKKALNPQVKIDSGIIRALVSRITVEEDLDTTQLCLGMAQFQLQRHLLNPNLLPVDPGTVSANVDNAHTPSHWVDRVQDTLYRFTAILAARNRTDSHSPLKETHDISGSPTKELLEQRLKALQFAKELAHHAQAAGNKALYQDIYTGANLYEEKEMEAWLQPNEQQKAEREIIFRQEESAQSILQALAPEEIESETAQQALAQIENARRYRDRGKPHRLVWEPYHLLTLLGPNIYVISTNPVCDAIIRLIKERDLQVHRHGIQTSHLDNLTEIGSQKYILKTLVPMKTRTMEKRLEKIPAFP